MAASQTTSTRINPFVLPPETNARFVLLVVAALSLALLSGIVISFAAGLVQATLETIIIIPNGADERFLSDVKGISSTNTAFHLLRILFPLGMITLVLFVAVFRYRRHPQRVCGQGKLEPLDPEKGNELKQAVRKMAAISGLDPTPDIVSNPSIRSQGAQAFGLPKQYVIRLDGYWRMIVRKKPEILQTTLLHEMGHIVNGDVSRYYFTEALWHATHRYAFIPMIVVLSFLLLQAFGDRLLSTNNDWDSFFTRNLPTYFTIGFQIGIVWLITKAIRASVLRVREYYADARAILWGAQQGLRMILGSQGATESRREQIRGWWKLHPTAAERLATVDDPERLFKFAVDLPFLVGFLVAIVSFGAFALFGDLTSGLGFALVAAAAKVVEMAEAKMSYLLVGLAFGLLILMIILSTILLFLPVFVISYLMSNVLGLQLLREGLYNKMAGRVGNGRYKQFGLVTFLWLLGLELGFLILPLYKMSPFVFLYPEVDLWRIFSIIVWWISTSMLIGIWLLFSRLIGIRWLNRFSGTTVPQWRLRIIMTMTTVVLWLFLIPIATSRLLILFGSATDVGPFLMVIVLSLTAGLCLCGLLLIR